MCAAVSSRYQWMNSVLFCVFLICAVQPCCHFNEWGGGVTDRFVAWNLVPRWSEVSVLGDILIQLDPKHSNSLADFVLILPFWKWTPPKSLFNPEGGGRLAGWASWLTKVTDCVALWMWIHNSHRVDRKATTVSLLVWIPSHIFFKTHWMKFHPEFFPQQIFPPKPPPVCPFRGCAWCGNPIAQGATSPFVQYFSYHFKNPSRIFLGKFKKNPNFPHWR